MKQVLLKYLTRFRNLSKFPLLILAAVLGTTAITAYLQTSVYTSNIPSAIRQKADQHRLLQWLKNDSLKSITNQQDTQQGFSMTKEASGNSLCERCNRNSTFVIRRQLSLLRQSVLEDLSSKLMTDCGRRLFWVLDNMTSEPDPDRAMHSLPEGLQIKESGIVGAGLGVWTLERIPKCTLFGPYEGLKLYKDVLYKPALYGWLVVDNYGNPKYIVDAKDKSESNWMRYINCASAEEKQNVIPLQYNGEMFYYTRHPIEPGTELLVWYGNDYAEDLGLL